MKVSIIGSGKMAKGIAARLLSGGHEVTVHVRDLEKGNTLATELKSDAKEIAVNVVQVGGDVDDLVIVATHYGDVANVVETYAGFAGKTVVDITNPVDFNTFQLIPAAGTSGAEEIAKLAPQAHIIKAFNTIFAGTLAAGEVEGKTLDVLIAGDDQPAKQSVSEIIESSGLRPVDVGPLTNARHLEGLALIHMSVQEQLGTGWMSTIKFLGAKS